MVRKHEIVPKWRFRQCFLKVLSSIFVFQIGQNFNLSKLVIPGPYIFELFKLYATASLCAVKDSLICRQTDLLSSLPARTINKTGFNRMKTL